MIRKLQDTDITEVSNIWLDTNIKTHHYIPAQYWQDHFEVVKGLFKQSEIYVYEDDKMNKIQGFIGFNNSYIAGLFVCSSAQSKGIGKQLLDFAKKLKTELFLSVYEKNVRAVKFYQREKFNIHKKDLDLDTKEKEYIMKWKQ